MKLFRKAIVIIHGFTGNLYVNEYLMIGDSLKSDVEFASICNLDSCWFNKNNENLKLVNQKL